MSDDWCALTASECTLAILFSIASMVLSTIVNQQQIVLIGSGESQTFPDLLFKLHLKVYVGVDVNMHVSDDVTA